MVPLTVSMEMPRQVMHVVGSTSFFWMTFSLISQISHVNMKKPFSQHASPNKIVTISYDVISMAM